MTAEPRYVIQVWESNGPLYAILDLVTLDCVRSYRSRAYAERTAAKMNAEAN